jgi:site-specific recombinase XerD
LMLELGESPKTVQTMLGHASITTTLDIYSHVSLAISFAILGSDFSDRTPLDA